MRTQRRWGQQGNTRFQEWERFYNYDRPHGALQGRPPYERL
jgi:transposase InsO family protein